MIIFFALMAILCVFDCKFRHLPNLIVLPATIGAVIAFKTGWFALSAFCLASLIYSKGFWCGGDVKLATMVAAFLGFWGVLAIPVTIVLIKLYRKIRDYYPLPVVPFFIVATIVVVIAEHSIKLSGLR